VDLKLKRLLKIDYSQSLKPLDCGLCLAFWFGLLIAAPLGVIPAIKCGLISVLVERAVNRFEL